MREAGERRLNLQSCDTREIESADSFLTLQEREGI
jgi:hypothetical protein